MELAATLLFEAKQMACEFRPLNQADVTHEYVEGLKESQAILKRVSAKVSMRSQQKYINRIKASKNEIIYGLFFNKELVGTSGVQVSRNFLNGLINVEDGAATIGILLFHKRYIGLGFGKFLVWASALLFHKSARTNWFGADMTRDNIPSLKSFLSCGFRRFDEDDRLLKVALHFPELVKPSFITKVAISKLDEPAHWDDQAER
jgi:hypothetical protein